MKSGAWSEAEINTLFEMRAEGEKWTVIASILGRPYDAVVTFYRDEKRRRIGSPVPAKLPPESRPDFEASILLGQEVNRAIRRHAFLNRMTPDQAVRALLGGNDNRPTPGTERIYKTASAQRLAA